MREVSPGLRAGGRTAVWGSSPTGVVVVVVVLEVVVRGIVVVVAAPAPIERPTSGCSARVLTPITTSTNAIVTAILPVPRGIDQGYGDQRDLGL